MVEGARCVDHPEALAAAPCARCGDFACGVCLASSSMCPRCRPRVGRWVAGSELSTLGILWHALGLLPRFADAALVVALFVFGLIDVGAWLTSAPIQAKAPTPATMAGSLWGVAAVSLGVLMAIVLFPIVFGGAAARAGDLILGREPARSLFRAGARLWTRIFVLIVLEAVATTLIAAPFAVVVMAADLGEGAQLAVNALSTAAPVPVFLLFSLAEASAALDDVSAFAALGRAWRFVRSRPRDLVALFSIQLGLDLAIWGLGSVREALVERSPDVGLPFACGEALFESLSFVAWPIVFAAFWLARARPEATSP